MTFQKIRVALRDRLATKTPDEIKKFEDQIQDLSADFDRTITEIDPSGWPREDQQIFAEFEIARVGYDGFKARIVRDAKNGNLDDGWAILWSDPYAKVAIPAFRPPSASPPAVKICSPTLRCIV